MKAKVMQVMNLLPNTKFKNCHRGRVYSTEGIAPCLNCCGGGGLEPKIIVYVEQENRANAQRETNTD